MISKAKKQQRNKGRVRIVGFFDWFRKEKPASEHLTLNSIEFPWPKDRATNHARGANHWQNFCCSGSKKEALDIDIKQGLPYMDVDTGALMPPALVKYGVCSSCGKQGRVTSDDRAFHHLPISSGL